MHLDAPRMHPGKESGSLGLCSKWSGTVASPHPVPPRAEYRFTRETVAMYGRGGAAARERRFLAKYVRSEVRQRELRERAHAVV